jgi:hypothetical protein
VTEIVVRWANGTWANNGFILIGDPTDVTTYYSLEEFDEDETKRPKLVVEFE